MPGTIHLSICDYIYLFLGVVQNMVKETEHFIASEMEKKHMSQYLEKKNMAMCHHRKKYVFMTCIKFKGYQIRYFK